MKIIDFLIELITTSMDTRVNELKSAMRNFAKVLSEVPTAVPSAVTAKQQNNDAGTGNTNIDGQSPRSVGASLKIDTSSALGNSDAAATSDEVQQQMISNIGALSKALNTYFLYGTSQKNLDKLEELLVVAKSLPVTTSVLQANPSVAHNIKAASKGRGGRTKITVAAVEVMAAWKEKLVISLMGTPSPVSSSVDQSPTALQQPHEEVDTGMKVPADMPSHKEDLKSSPNKAESGADPNDDSQSTSVDVVVVVKEVVEVGSEEDTSASLVETETVNRASSTIVDKLPLVVSSSAAVEGDDSI